MIKERHLAWLKSLEEKCKSAGGLEAEEAAKKAVKEEKLKVQLYLHDKKDLLQLY